MKQGRRDRDTEEHIARVFSDNNSVQPVSEPEEGLEEGEIAYEFPSRRLTRRRRPYALPPALTRAMSIRAR